MIGRSDSHCTPFLYIHRTSSQTHRVPLPPDRSHSDPRCTIRAEDRRLGLGLTHLFGWMPLCTEQPVPQFFSAIRVCCYGSKHPEDLNFHESAAVDMISQGKQNSLGDQQKLFFCLYAPGFKITIFFLVCSVFLDDFALWGDVQIFFFETS